MSVYAKYVNASLILALGQLDNAGIALQHFCLCYPYLSRRSNLLACKISYIPFEAKLTFIATRYSYLDLCIIVYHLHATQYAALYLCIVVGLCNSSNANAHVILSLNSFSFSYSSL